MGRNREKTRSNEALVLALLDSAAFVERRLDRALANTRGISFSEFRMLRSLSTFQDGTGMRVELADAVGLTPSAITRALKPLEKLGYVSTQKSERDARRSLVTLSAAGFELLADARTTIADAISSLPLALLNDTRLSDFRNELLGKAAGTKTA